MDIVDLHDMYEEYREEYDALFDETLPEMEFDGKKLIECLKNQIPLMVRWEVMSKKLNYLFDEAELLSDELYAKAFSSAFTSEKYREISTTEAKEKAKADKHFQNARRLLNQIRHVRDEAKGILETVQSRKYIVNGMVSSITAGVENTIL